MKGYRDSEVMQIGDKCSNLQIIDHKYRGYYAARQPHQTIRSCLCCIPTTVTTLVRNPAEACGLPYERPSYASGMWNWNAL